MGMDHVPKILGKKPVTVPSVTMYHHIICLDIKAGRIVRTIGCNRSNKKYIENVKELWFLYTFYFLA